LTEQADLYIIQNVCSKYNNRTLVLFCQEEIESNTMFASEFDQEQETEDFVDDPEQWDDYPPDLEEAAYFQDGRPYFPPGPLYEDSLDFLSEEYLYDEYSTDAFPASPLPKFLFLCTILACLILAAGLSLVNIQASANGSQAVPESNLSPAQTGSGNQPQADSAQPSNLDNSTCSVSQRFPASIRRWCGLITQYAGKHGLPPDLVAALIWQESGGNPVAYSRSGAVGLMQVMPSDGLAASFLCSGGPCFSNRPNTDSLKDPEFNVSYGTKMLAGLVGRTGSLRDALKSYGPMDVGYYYADKVLGIYQRYGN